MPIPYAVFRPGKMLCPSCGAMLVRVADECHRCHFTAKVCLEKYPFQAQDLQRLIDPEERFESRDRKRINRAANQFERRFPQTAVSICITRLPKGADAREFGYWLFNVSPPKSPEAAQRRYFTLLLVIDRAHRTAAATIGYGLDTFIDDGALKKLLSSSREHFQQGHYAEGITHFLKATGKHLRDQYKEISQNAAHWQEAQLKSQSTPQHEQTTVTHDPHIVTKPA
ncbi:MAG: TPM domain-containing protein [Verrucomicrobiota bacterium]